jgi:adenosylhomocysteine/aminodeoxyfutalosine nucleosidase
MKIAIMGAMPEEIIPLLEKIGTYAEFNIGLNKYYTAKYNEHDLVIAYSKIGKVFATITATIMIEHFKCEILLFSGVAGGINQELKIGDLIYAKSLVQHDLDITAFGHPYGFVPEGKVFISTNEKLNTIALEVSKEKNIKLKSGVIATGDQFIHNSEKKEWIKQTFKADAIEMEGAAVAVVCDALKVPFFILRAISDEADGNADFDFDTFLESSAKNSAQFLMAMVDRI